MIPSFGFSFFSLFARPLLLLGHSPMENFGLLQCQVSKISFIVVMNIRFRKFASEGPSALASQVLAEVL